MNQPELIAVSPRPKAKSTDGFTRIPGPSGGHCRAQWSHTSGYTIIHCGHPTAHRPYYIEGPDGRSIFAPDGRAFWKLADTKAAVLKLVANNGPVPLGAMWVTPQ